jgi:hypothetical protein
MLEKAFSSLGVLLLRGGQLGASALILKVLVLTGVPGTVFSDGCLKALCDGLPPPIFLTAPAISSCVSCKLRNSDTWVSAQTCACDLRDRVPLRPLVQNSKDSDDIVEAKFVSEAKSELCSLSQNVSGRHNTCV